MITIVHNTMKETNRLPSYREAYSLGIYPPNYPVPAIVHEVEIQHDRVILWRKLKYWEFMYLASTIPTKLLNRWAE